MVTYSFDADDDIIKMETVIAAGSLIADYWHYPTNVFFLTFFEQAIF